MKQDEVYRQICDITYSYNRTVQKSYERYGYRRIHASLSRESIRVSEKIVR